MENVEKLVDLLNIKLIEFDAEIEAIEKKVNYCNLQVDELKNKKRQITDAKKDINYILREII